MEWVVKSQSVVFKTCKYIPYSTYYYQKVEDLSRLWSQGIYYSRNIILNDICVVKIGVIKIGLRMYMGEREQCRAMTRHCPWILGNRSQLVRLAWWWARFPSPVRRGLGFGQLLGFFGTSSWGCFIVRCKYHNHWPVGRLVPRPRPGSGPFGWRQRIFWP